MKKTITLLALSTLFSMISCWNGAFAQEPLTFTGSILNPLLIHGDPGSCDEMLVAPFCLWDDGTFYIYYTGNAGACIATSTDGYNYYKIAGNLWVLQALGSIPSEPQVGLLLKSQTLSLQCITTRGSIPDGVPANPAVGPPPITRQVPGNDLNRH